MATKLGKGDVTNEFVTFAMNIIIKSVNEARKGKNLPTEHERKISLADFYLFLQGERKANENLIDAFNRYVYSEGVHEFEKLREKKAEKAALWVDPCANA